MIHNSAGAKPLNQIANIKNNIIPLSLSLAADTNQLPTMNVRIQLAHTSALFAAIISRYALRLSPRATK
jgi:hypothetical protein